MTDEKQTPDQLKSILESGSIGNHKIDIYIPEGLPASPNRETVLNSVSADLHPLIDLMYTFLETPLVEDHFGTDDVSRDAWEKKVEEELGSAGLAIIQRNRLRPNVYQEAVSVVKALPEYLDNSNLQQYADAVDDRLLDPNEYKQLDTDTKKNLINGLHRNAVLMLTSLSSQ